MTHDFENMSYDDADRIALLESRAAELERLLAVIRPDALPGWANTPGPAHTGPADTGRAHTGPAGAAPQADLPGGTPSIEEDAYEETEEDPYEEDPYDTEAYAGEAAQPAPDAPAAPGAAADWPGDDEPDGPDGRTEALINHGRPRARQERWRRLPIAHWRLLAVGVVALVAGLIAALLATGGSGASWPASVATVQAQVKQACANPDVAAEPSGLNFACAKDTQQVLWVFALLTSGDNPGFVDASTGRKGLEPIQPSQGGDIAWSLNLHHPYDPANPIDSLTVAARAVNNIISGATLTSANGGALVEPGLESKAANCQRYTGSAKLATRAGYPARCASPVSGAGAAALVSDVFRQWMGGSPSRTATQAGVLFENAADPGNPQVQAILHSLPASGG